MSACPSVCSLLSACPSVCSLLSACPSVCSLLSACPSVCSLLSACPSVCSLLYACPSVCSLLSACPSVYSLLSACPSVCSLLSLPLPLSVHSSPSLSLCQYVCLQDSVAIGPLAVYISGFLTTLVLRVINKYIGRYVRQNKSTVLLFHPPLYTH